MTCQAPIVVGNGEVFAGLLQRRYQMKKLFMVVFVAGLIGAVPAQAGQKGEKPATGKDGMKPSTITGCVAQSGARYRLDHAIVGTDPDVDTQSRPATEASPTPKMMSYALTGADLKAHLGHKVEVTGTISSDKTSKDTAEIEGVPGMQLVGTLTVKSVKMVSETCP
jgi:hypothetical protein